MGEMMGSITSKALRELQGAIDGRVERKAPKTAQTVAGTVTGAKAGALRVLVDGAAESTPVDASACDVSVGDSVTCVISDGSMSITGNTTAPATSQKAVNATVAPIADEAARARLAADSATADAAIANAAANGAVTSLGVVEDIAGTLTWLADHGTYTLAQDTAIDPNKTYWTLDEDSGTYSAVASPTASGLAGYYELSIDETVTQYVASHLALTDSGLYLTTDGDAGRLLLSSKGVTLYGADGNAAATFGDSITFDSSHAFAIGADDAYILFSPADYTYSLTSDTEPVEGKTYYQLDDDGGYSEVESPVAGGMAGYYERFGNGASIAIGGSNVSFADTPLSERLQALENADSGLESRVAGNEKAIDGMQSLISIDTSEGSITLGGSNSVTARLDNDSLDFNTSAGTVATIGVDNGEGVMDVTRARISDSLEIGAGLWAWTPRNNGNLTLRWIGE
jgi:hypothetical protein